jgi:hypothetical protein
MLDVPREIDTPSTGPQKILIRDTGLLPDDLPRPMTVGVRTAWIFFFRRIDCGCQLSV